MRLFFWLVYPEGRTSLVNCNYAYMQYADNFMLHRTKRPMEVYEFLPNLKNPLARKFAAVRAKCGKWHNLNESMRLRH